MKALSSYLWTEKYRPDAIKGIILPASVKTKLSRFLTDGEIANLLLYSNSPGTGKTTTAKALCNDLGADFLYINASKDGNIDTLRSEISKFATVKSLTGKPKVVTLDECLEENEEILMGKLEDNKVNKLKDLKFGKKYDIISFNLKTGELENDECELISERECEVFEVELESGKKIYVSSNHPFIIKNNGEFQEKSIDNGLSESDSIVIND